MGVKERSKKRKGKERRKVESEQRKEGRQTFRLWMKKEKKRIMEGKFKISVLMKGGKKQERKRKMEERNKEFGGGGGRVGKKGRKKRRKIGTLDNNEGKYSMEKEKRSKKERKKEGK